MCKIRFAVLPAIFLLLVLLCANASASYSSYDFPAQSNTIGEISDPVCELPAAIPVPEPSTALLLAMGLTGLLALRRLAR